MAETTGISWADSTFNPWIGCTRVSPACDDCYAARSTPARALGVVWGSGETRRRTSDANWKLPLQWERQHAAFFAEHGHRRRVFCASLADVFDNEVDPQWRVDLWKLIEATPNLDWLVLTKRIGIVPSWVALHGIPSNVWLGITVVNQAEADRDIPKLLAVPAAVRFLSIEPMLGPIELTRVHESPRPGVISAWHCLDGYCVAHFPRKHCGCPRRGSAIDWVIAGGESGPQARPSHPDWYRSLRDQCAAAGVPFLFKQWGEWAPVKRTVGLDDRIKMPGQNRDVWAWPDGTRDGWRFGPVSLRIGKQAAGHLLDGVEHQAFPEVAR